MSDSKKDETLNDKSLRRDSLRVQYIHGLGGSPEGVKASYLAEHFITLAPEMDTSNFEGAVRAQGEALIGFRPDVLVGSSFGGAIALVLLQRSVFRGPTLLLAPAITAYDIEPRIPDNVFVHIVHGTQDDVVNIEDSRALSQTGSNGMVTLFEVEDTHRLPSLVESDRLGRLIPTLAAFGKRGSG